MDRSHSLSDAWSRRRPIARREFWKANTLFRPSRLQVARRKAPVCSFLTCRRVSRQSLLSHRLFPFRSAARLLLLFRFLFALDRHGFAARVRARQRALVIYQWMYVPFVALRRQIVKPACETRMTAPIRFAFVSTSGFCKMRRTKTATSSFPTARQTKQ